MSTENKSLNGNSKKRPFKNLRPKVKRSTPYSTLTVEFPDGSIKVVKPNMAVFDGDWKTLALSLCEGHRITWRMS